MCSMEAFRLALRDAGEGCQEPLSCREFTGSREAMFKCFFAYFEVFSMEFT